MACTLILRWEATPIGRALYAGDQPDPVAIGVRHDNGVSYSVCLPGDPMKLRIGNIAEAEDCIKVIVSAWFRLAVLA